MSGWHKPNGKEIEKIYRNRPRRHGKKAKQQSQNAGENTEDTIVQRQAKEAYTIRQEFIKEYKESKHNTRALITAASCYMEYMINYIIERKCKTGEEVSKNRYIPLGSKVMLIYELGILDQTLYEDVKKFIDLRNKAVHYVNFRLPKSFLDGFHCFKEAGREIQGNLRERKDAIVDITECILLKLEEKYQDYVWPAAKAGST